MHPRSTLGGTALAVVLAGACGTPAHPAALGGTVYDGGVHVGDDGGPSLFTDAGPVEKSCGVGPDGGVCACADEPLLGDPPTLYFVLDRSGSMSDSNKWITVQEALEKLWIELGPRAKVAAAVFPAISQDTCARGQQVFPSGNGAPLRGDTPSGTVGPNELQLLQVLGSIPAYGGTPTAATLTGIAPLVEAIPGKTVVVLATDGGPNCDATPECYGSDAGASCQSETCPASMCTDNIEAVSPCTPGGPPNCCDPSFGGPDAPLACLDAQPTIDGVIALAAAGIPVYVVGVPGSEPYAALLDELATAGGTARGSEPQYYAVGTTDQAALLTALSKIAAKVAGACTLTLDQAPPDPTLINVFLDGTALPQQGPDGWTLDGTTVTILGASCQAILDGDVLDVRVVAGCPTVEL
ncbi:MAG TPA: vWA domain-containing protein [Polyangiaceae bacterium]